MMPERITGQARRRRIIILAAAAVIVSAYFSGRAYYGTHFAVGGSIAGSEIRGMTPDEARAEAGRAVSDISAELITRDGRETVTADSAGLACDVEAVEDLFAGQRRNLWFVELFRSAGELGVSLSIDPGMLSDAVSGLSCVQPENVTEPEDAHIELAGVEFVIVPETDGNLPDAEAVTEAVASCLESGGGQVVLDDLGCYEEAKVKADDARLLSELDELNAAAQMTVTYVFGDEEITLTGNEIARWIVLDGGFSWHADSGAVSAFVAGMAEDTDTYGTPKGFTKHDGSRVTLSGGDYGWLIDREATADILTGLIEAGKSVTAEPSYSCSALSRCGDAIGESYVEISIPEQTLWVYKDGECVVETPVVTGCAVNGNGTPSGGVWSVKSREADRMLSGDGYSSHVDYWLPFNGNVGIHDASWRGSFGGEIYKTNGSHGCVNVPPSVMPDIYEAVHVGWPVIVY